MLQENILPAPSPKAGWQSSAWSLQEKVSEPNSAPKVGQRKKKKPQQGVGFNHPEEKKYFKSFLIKKPLGVEGVYSASKGFRSTFLDPDSGPRPPQESSYITPTIPDAGPSSLRPELSPSTPHSSRDKGRAQKKTSVESIQWLNLASLQGPGPSGSLRPSLPSPPPSTPLLCSSHTGFRAARQASQAYSCPRAFALPLQSGRPPSSRSGLVQTSFCKTAISSLSHSLFWFSL